MSIIIYGCYILEYRYRNDLIYQGDELSRNMGHTMSRYNMFSQYLSLEMIYSAIHIEIRIIILYYSI